MSRLPSHLRERSAQGKLRGMDPAASFSHMGSQLTVGLFCNSEQVVIKVFESNTTAVSILPLLDEACQQSRWL